MIKRFLEMAKDYLKQAAERKIRLVVAVLVLSWFPQLCLQFLPPIYMRDLING